MPVKNHDPTYRDLSQIRCYLGESQTQSCQWCSTQPEQARMLYSMLYPSADGFNIADGIVRRGCFWVDANNEHHLYFWTQTMAIG